MFHHITCEPLRAWNRLEPRSRSAQFDQALRAEIHDPLWMLARQWQFGEFKGDDAGSAILARLAVRTTRLRRYRAGDGGFVPFPAELPLETVVEREPLPTDANTRAQLGRQFLRILAHHGDAFDAGGGTPRFADGNYRSLFTSNFGLSASLPAGTDPDSLVARARREANPRLDQFLHATAGRVVDGVKLYQAIPAGSLTWSSLPASLRTGIAAAHQSVFLASYQDLRALIEATWSRPLDPNLRAWDDSRLEYRFACELPRPGGGSLVLTADEYFHGHLDWYSLELGPSVAGNGGDDDGIEVRVMSMLPSPAEFPGMPKPRWWEFEDAAVDFGNISTDRSDFAKVVVSQFTLVYGNNWLVFPVPQEVGTLAEVLGVVVTDVFGQRTFVRSATHQVDTDWTRWDFFSLSGREPGSELGSHLLLPPVTADVHESEAVERVHLLRDEIANSVWAIEDRVADELGRSRDGREAGRRFRARLADLDPTPTPAYELLDDTKLEYRLGTTVPEHWIPFIPVQIPGGGGQVRLQRASMPRFFAETVRPIRPTTELLRPGLDAQDRQSQPFYLREEEVPRAGVRVEACYQRTRWFDGRTLVWYGRRKRSGRGEAGSGLRFDVVEPIRPNEKG